MVKWHGVRAKEDGGKEDLVKDHIHRPLTSAGKYVVNQNKTEVSKKSWFQCDAFV